MGTMPQRFRDADVGISVDSGADIAKESADIILLEKQPVGGAERPRNIFGNTHEIST